MTKTPAHDLPEPLLAYFAQREAARADAVTTFLASLTDRERALIKDVGVMGYVRGRMHPQSEKHPKDSAVLAEVVDACLALPDLYPAVNADPGPGDRRATPAAPPRDVSPTAALLASRCDACQHTLNRHTNYAGCTVPLCVCGRFQPPADEEPTP